MYYTFKQYLLLEKIGKSDIIDLFLIMSMPEPSSASGKFIVSEIVGRARKNILDELENILLDELTNLGHSDYEDDRYDITQKEFTKKEYAAMNTLFNTEIDNPRDLFLRFYKIVTTNTNEGRESSISEINNTLNTNITFDSIASTFQSPIWGEIFGGKTWAKFTNMVIELVQINQPTAFLKKFERFIDVVHNTGVFQDKLSGDREGWMTFILDLKQHSRNIRDLIPYMSKDARTLLSEPNWRISAHETTKETPSLHIEPSLIKRLLRSDRYLPDEIGNLVSHYGIEKVINTFKIVIDNLAKQKTLGKLVNLYLHMEIIANRNPALSPLRDYARATYDQEKSKGKK